MAGVIGTIVKHAARRVTNRQLGAGLALNAAFSGVDYMMRRSEGDSVGKAALGAAGTFALWEFLPSVAIAQMGYQMASAIGAIGTEAYFAGKDKKMHASHGFGHSFTDTATRQTMRQRAMQQAHESGMAARYVLGNEARMINRNNLGGR